MKEKERIVACGLLTLLLISWLGFIFHRSPRFAGSLAGGALGVSAALLMLIPFLYLVIKRVSWLKRSVTRRISLRTLLAWHIYAGILGPILALLHTGHKFDSILGIWLTGFMLVVVFSGFVGRYLLSFISEELKEKKMLLDRLEQEYHASALELVQHPDQAELVRSFTGFWPRLLSRVYGSSSLAMMSVSGPAVLPAKVVQLSEAIADVEYAIKTHDTFKTVFSRWLRLHIVISFIFLALLVVHVASEIYFGLRWFK